MVIVRHIAKEKLVFSLPIARPDPLRVPGPATRPPSPGQGFDVGFHGVDPEFLADILFGRKSPFPHHAPPREQAFDPTAGEATPQKKIRAKFASRCGRCGNFIVVGQAIHWTSGRAPHCEPCGPIP